MCENNVTEDKNLEKLLPVTTDTVSLVTKDNWQGSCKHTENIKKEYCKRDTVISDIMALSYTSSLTAKVTDTESGSSDTEDCSDCHYNSASGVDTDL